MTSVAASPVRLTQYAHGAGCGCKISPAVLTRMLDGIGPGFADPRLLVGHGARDDAAVYALDDERVLISTTDFFMPIVDDAFDFGAVAATNAISDVYAMGGTPILAIAILGWPVSLLDAAIAGDVLRGATEACARAGIALAGGHSIDAPEPIFGLAVTGTGRRADVRTNAQARAGCELYLTKPLGVGVLTTAMKRGILRDDDCAEVRRLMLTLNDVGPALARLDAVATMTDVTGFGLLGHLLEVCDASGLSAEVRVDDVPRLASAAGYIASGAVPGGTTRNAASYGHRVAPLPDAWRDLLCDPQTSGGLLVAVDPAGRDEFLRVTRERGLDLRAFGVLTPRAEPTIRLV
ncbi:Selenide, water dikinase (plasmid) [Gemmatirosa kalamazoonensis]|uniref:Selenide, water dikinase n=1 Tax=Gemmatirosa kalamazoonensis TaxID=861299 RepID=W0RSM8_9BACT|nr:selenide, water dikinase SelD [Gemmatirosa kalamazoonensis]AHG93477.1 Selenide, water dikinase [Gemmatirosa kalamazoonensis]